MNCGDWILKGCYQKLKYAQNYDIRSTFFTVRWTSQHVNLVSMALLATKAVLISGGFQMFDTLQFG